MKFTAHLLAEHNTEYGATIILWAPDEEDAHAEIERIMRATGFRLAGNIIETPDKPGFVVKVYEDGVFQDETPVAHDDYFVMCTGSRHIAHVNHYPRTGTVQLTIKKRH